MARPQADESRLLKKINPASLVPMDLFQGEVPLRVDLAYAQPYPKSFCGVIYRKGARLWLHEDLARVVLGAARLAKARHGLILVLYDGLRTTTAQGLMRETPVVRANPQWLEGETRLLSPPGRGAHPRGMAIDVSLETQDGRLLDMGTPFDEMSTGGSGPLANRAHREHQGLPAEVYENRKKLTSCMVDAAKALGLPMLPLPQEWWDFRFPPETYDAYTPLADEDLPPQMRMTDMSCAGGVKDFPSAHFEAKKRELLSLA